MVYYNYNVLLREVAYYLLGGWPLWELMSSTSWSLSNLKRAMIPLWLFIFWKGGTKKWNRLRWDFFAKDFFINVGKQPQTTTTFQRVRKINYFFFFYNEKISYNNIWNCQCYLFISLDFSSTINVIQLQLQIQFAGKASELSCLSPLLTLPGIHSSIIANSFPVDYVQLCLKHCFFAPYSWNFIWIVVELLLNYLKLTIRFF